LLIKTERTTMMAEGAKKEAELPLEGVSEDMP
jgi:hypothetical protein